MNVKVLITCKGLVDDIFATGCQEACFCQEAGWGVPSPPRRRAGGSQKTARPVKIKIVSNVE